MLVYVKVHYSLNPSDASVYIHVAQGVLLN